MLINEWNQASTNMDEAPVQVTGKASKESKKAIRALKKVNLKKAVKLKA